MSTASQAGTEHAGGGETVQLGTPRGVEVTQGERRAYTDVWICTT